MNWLRMCNAFAAILCSVIASAGCQKPAATPTGPATATSGESEANTPEATFTAIVEEFRRGVEEEPIGFVVQDGAGGKTMMTGSNQVTHEILAPKNDGDPLKAVIRVTSETKYSMQRTTESGATETNEAPKRSSNGALAEGDAQVFDPSIASTPGQNGKSASPTDSVTGKALITDEKDERSYELVYENGRWKLTTKLDDKTEGLIKLAFERALATQG
jgi:hypothetical protein